MGKRFRVSKFWVILGGFDNIVGCVLLFRFIGSKFVFFLRN